MKKEPWVIPETGEVIMWSVLYDRAEVEAE
jgi:hypothetical protein